MENELVTFGESMLRLSPPEGERIEVANELEFRVAGAESNVAIAAGRLGVDSVWLSKLNDSPLGRKVTTSIQQHGVATDIVWTDKGRQGAYYLEFGTEPRGTNVIYDRANAAVTTAVSSELPVERIQDARLFYTSGITPALSPTLRTTTRSLLDAAQSADTTTVFDLNYRAKLWPTEAAREAYESLLPLVDILVAAERDVRSVLNCDGTPEALVRELKSNYDNDVVILTQGDDGATGVAAADVIHQPAYEVKTVDPVGTGDAFLGGFLAQYLESNSFEESLDYAAATAALTRTIRGDAAVVTSQEVAALQQDGSRGIDR
jgi:2-dehydro-3-deoxygluconokinase